MNALETVNTLYSVQFHRGDPIELPITLPAKTFSAGEYIINIEALKFHKISLCKQRCLPESTWYSLKGSRNLNKDKYKLGLHFCANLYIYT